MLQGCDGSILLNSLGGLPSEKEAIPNLSLRGFGTIDRVKAKLERACGRPRKVGGTDCRGRGAEQTGRLE